MSFVVYHKPTTYLLQKRLGRSGLQNGHWETEAAAKAALTRAHRAFMKATAGERNGRPYFLVEDPADWAIADGPTFFRDIEKKVKRKSLMGGGEFEIGVNTPCYMDPSTESYWSA